MKLKKKIAKVTKEAPCYELVSLALKIDGGTPKERQVIIGAANDQIIVDFIKDETDIDITVDPNFIQHTLIFANNDTVLFLEESNETS
jgi:hypothetical protein